MSLSLEELHAWPHAEESIALLAQSRRLMLGAIKGLTEDQLFKIPTGRKNNIAWNLGHALVSQQSMHYALGGLERRVPMAWVELLKAGTSPTDWKKPVDLGRIKEQLAATPSLLLEDVRAGRFAAFTPYTTSTGVELATRTQADAFNHFHEGVHTGIILSIRREVA